MRASEVSYGEPAEVEEWLMSTDMGEISHEDLIGALANAMRRIAHLETELAHVRCKIAEGQPCDTAS